MATTPLVSIVIPVLRDTVALTRLLETVAVGAGDGGSALRSPSGCEVIVVNGDPEDVSLREVRPKFPDVQWVEGARGRGNQMNVGARLAGGRWLLFLHADTLPDPGWLDEIRCIDANTPAGAFRFALDSSARIARLLEWGVALRVRWLGLPYGDQGLLVRRSVFEAVGGYAPLPIMEDVDLVRRLRRRGPIARLPVAVRASARRWERDGLIRRSTLNLALVVLFLAGVSPRWLARRYYGSDPTPSSEASSELEPSVVRSSATADAEPTVVVIIPALDEEDAIGKVLAEIPDLVTTVTVVDNGSTDRTAERAQAAGATVVGEPRRGYGRACLAGLRANSDADIVVFLDGDRSDFPSEMTTLLDPILAGTAEFVLGDRGTVGRPVSARLGTSLCVFLVNRLWGTDYRDLGPFRAIRKADLDRLRMVDETWGWTIEMQVKAQEAGLRTVEVPVRQRARIGPPKISGTIQGTLCAGSRMLATIWSLWWTRSRRSTAARVGGA